MLGARHHLVVAVLGASVVLAGCGGEGDGSPFEVLSAAAVTVDDPLPVGADPILLVRERGGETSLALDLDSLVGLETVEATVEEPWLDTDIRFRGVWIRDVIDRVGPPGAPVEIHALDDYVVHFEPGELQREDALLATHADGDAIPVSEGGPIRLVFLEPGVGDDHERWIWSIDVITVG